MIKDYYKKICAGQDVRANLISIREELKDEKNRRAFAYMLGGDFSVLCGLLEQEDPKVRRNAAFILGKMESEDLLPILFAAYQKEETKFIRADYLKAISGMEFGPLVSVFEKKLEELSNQDIPAEDRKHVNEEIRALQSMVMKYKKPERHKFQGYDEKPDVILVTNRCQREATAKQIEGGQISWLAGGLRITDVELGKILPVRTYSEWMLPIPMKKGQILSVDAPENIGQLMFEPFLSLAQKLHKGRAPFLFRIELKGKIAADKKGIYVRKIADAMEKASGRKLINSVSDYEIELRLLEKKDGTYAPMFKVYTAPDKRFLYRKETVAASISPVNAALTAELTKQYMKENAQILDPFCGVGTMLIERNKCVKAGTMYGLDIFGEAIDKARENTSHAGCRANYINRDFFDFTHEYSFDEVISNLPQAVSESRKEEIADLYGRFFEKIGELLKPEAVLILYSTEPKLLKAAVRPHEEYRIAEEFIMNEKNQTTVFVIQRKR